jgi:hypothetical protein
MKEPSKTAAELEASIKVEMERHQGDPALRGGFCHLDRVSNRFPNNSPTVRR